MRASQALLPEDETVEVSLTYLNELQQEALIIKRFDRTQDDRKLHFEEFNQLLNQRTFEKYDGAYKDMAEFIASQKACIPSDNYRLFKRIVVGLLLGNTDMHFKNFAMLHTVDGLRLSPNYDQVAAAIYEPFQYVALVLDRTSDRIITQIKSKHIIALGHELHLNDPSIMMAIRDIEKHLEAAKDTVNEACLEHSFTKQKIIQFMEKRWNGTFTSIGQQLLKKP